MARARGVKKGEAKRTANKKRDDHIEDILETSTRNLRPVVEKAIQDSVDDYAIPNGSEQTLSALTEKFRSLIPRPSFDDAWTEGDEEELVQEAARDHEFQHRCHYENYMAFVWKTAYKFMGCLATDIVGPKTYLRFHSDHATSRHRYWADYFGQKLSSLIVQPIFGGMPDKLALAIQWTVICRTNDRRRWRLSGCDDEDEFLRVLKSAVERSQRGKRNPGKLRRAALRLFRGRYPGRTGQNPVWNQFLQRIEEQAPRAPPAQHEADSQDFGDFALYRVNTTDLNNILEAITHVRVSGFPMFPDPTTVSMTALYTRDSTDLPQKPQIMEANEAALLSHRREARRAQNQRFLEGPGAVNPFQSSRSQTLVSSHLQVAESLSVFDEKLRDAEAETSEDDEEEDVLEEPRKAQAPRRSTRHRATTKAHTPVFTSSSDEDNEDDEGEIFRQTPIRRGPGRPRKQPTASRAQAKFSIEIPRAAASSSLARGEYEAVEEPDDEYMLDYDVEQMDPGDIDLGEDVKYQPDTGGPSSKRKSETLPNEPDARPTKLRRSEKGSRSLNSVEIYDSEEEQDEESKEEEEQQVLFLTGPYQERRLRHPVPQSLPIVPANLGLADAIKQITGQNAALKAKAVQDLRKVKRSMLDQVDWLDKDDPGYWLRDPLDCWPRTTK